MLRSQRMSRAAFLGLAATLSLGACTAGYTAYSKAGAAGSSVTVALTGAPVNLDFTTTAGAAIPQALMSNVYEGLVEIDQDGRIQPLLASAWEVSADRSSYTFTLQPGVLFSNGEPFTAHEVKFSIERVQSDAWKSSLKAKMDVVKAVTVLSDTQVRIDLKQPSNAWLYDMGTPIGAMFHPQGVSDLATKPVGTGPFEVTAWNAGDSLNFTARSDYWGPAPALKTATLRYFADATATTNALQAGDVDLVYNMQSPELLSAFAEDPLYQVIQGTSTGEIVLSMNNQAAPFDDVRVRRAVMYAIDRKAVRDTAWNGLGTLVGGPVPPSDPYYEDLTGVYPYDPAKARTLLREAGAESLSITFSVPTRPYATAISEIVVSQLRDVGINATIASTEFPAVWLDQVFTKHDYQMSIIAAVEPRDVLTMFNDPDYYLGFDNSGIQADAAAADRADQAGYVAGMKKVVRTIVEQAGADVLFILPNIVIAKAGLADIPANAVTPGLDLGALRWS
ncbi:ABC transporter substrate-binding protein [Micrococcales bacterium 31B]|nr:ABC transporter substrate-binding protein [Micrococcales bacterium 31B]